MSLRIESSDGRTQFEPGERIGVIAEWDLESQPAAIEARLVWQTSGKGSPDSRTLRSTRFDSPSSCEWRQWEIILPDAPYSFSGKLISLVWQLEIEVEPSGENAHTEITIAPGGKEVVLQSAQAESE